MPSLPVILYVEDNPDDAFFFERARRRISVPHLCHHASNGLEARDIIVGAGEFADRARWPQPTVNLSDNKMQLMTGLELLEWLRRQPAFDQIPFYLLTTSDHEMDLDAARRWNVTDYVRKPSNADDYPGCVQRLFEAIARDWPAKV
jgi:CheY-like chemotaxis protein